MKIHVWWPTEGEKGGGSGLYVGLQIEMYGFKLWSDT